MKHYIAVLMPHSDREWRAYLPDFPGCRAAGSTPDEAIRNTRQNVHRFVDGQAQHQLPQPRSLGEIQSDRDWSSKRAIEWNSAIVSLVGIDSGGQTTVARAMPDSRYRCYFLRDSHILAVEVVECDNDAAAMAKGADIIASSAFELLEIWNGDRKIGQVQRPGTWKP